MTEEGKRQRDEGRTIGEALRPRREKAQPADHPDLAYIGLEHVEAHSMRLLGSVPAETMRSQANRFYAGDVLYSRLRPYLNKVWLADRDGLCSAEFIVLPGNEVTDSDFLRYRLNARDFVQFANSLNAGDRPRVDFDQISSFILPPFSLEQQRRIVAKIEELFSELDEGVANLKKARAQLAVYRQALLKHAFEGHLTADWRSLHKPVATIQSTVPHSIESWRFTTLGDLTEYITSGSRGWAEFYADTGPIFIRAANLNRDHLDLSDVAYVSLPDGVEGTRTRTRLGDVFVTITGANVTKAGFLDRELGEAYVSQHVALCRPIDPSISEYLYLYIISNAGGRRDLEKAAYGAGKPGLNLDNLRTLQIPMPTRAEIPIIVEGIRSQLSEVNALEADIDLNLQKAEALRQSILKKAFAGELVPQDPADEPAAALLARIRAERQTQDAQPAAKRSGKRPPKTA